MIGTVAILLLGAFSRNPMDVSPPLTAVESVSVEPTIEAAGGPELPPGLSPGLAEIIKMAEARVDESVIIEFIHNSGQTYAPTADEILYLSDIGLSQAVIAALLNHKLPTKSAAAVAVTATPPEKPADVDNSFFQKTLAPYGTWTQIPDLGACWQPTVEIINDNWRPYVDDGQWLYTDNGWYWQSDYSWGWIAFHYGRWTKNPHSGWVWVPDKVWGPAWVSWRIALNYSGWAPLPPGAALTAAGLTFYQRHVSPDFDFGLPAGWFTFVSEDSFFGPQLVRNAVSGGEAEAIFARSIPVNNYSLANQKVLNFGPGREAFPAPEASPATAFAETMPTRMPEPIIKRPVVAREDVKVASDLVDDISVTWLPVTPLLERPKTFHHHWSGLYPSGWTMAAAPRWEASFKREVFEPERSPATAPSSIPLELPKILMSTAVSSSSKSAK
jgi:hypothetical protein